MIYYLNNLYYVSDKLVKSLPMTIKSPCMKKSTFMKFNNNYKFASLRYKISSRVRLIDVDCNDTILVLCRCFYI